MRDAFRAKGSAGRQRANTLLRPAAGAAGHFKGKAVGPPSTDDFEARLARARGRRESASARTQRSTALGLAFRLSVELVAGVVVGTGIGWFLDRWLGTAPLLLIVFFLLGVAAGFVNVFRTARLMNASVGTDQGGAGAPVASGTDEEEEDEGPPPGKGNRGS